MRGKRGIDADDLRIRLPVHYAREAVQPVAPDAPAPVCGVAVGVLVEQDTDGQVRRMQAELQEVVVQLLDPRLVLDGRVREVAAAGAVGRVLAGGAVDVVQAFGLRVPRLVVLVGERPRGGDAAVMLDLPEVLGPQAEQGGAVELGVAADVVVLLGRELVALPVVPLLVGRVLALEKDRGRVPVVALAGEVAASLEQQDALSGRRQLPCEGPAACARCR